MTDADRYDSDDLLDRSIGAIRRAQAPPGPDGKAAADTLAALRRAAGGGIVASDDARFIALFRKILFMAYLHKKAVALTVAVAGCSVWIALLLVGAFSTVSFAQVAEKLRNVHTMTCTARTTTPGQATAMTARMEYLGNKMRSEVPDLFISINNPETGQSLILDPKTKTARLVKVEVIGPHPKLATELDPIGEMRKLAGKKGEPAGEQQIRGVKAKGLRVTEDSKEFTVWIDPATDLPVRIDMVVESAGKKMSIMFDELAFDVPLDEKRFSLEPPPGYTLSKQELSVNMNVEENVVTLLRATVAANGGKFPDQLNDPAALARLAGSDDKGNPTPEYMKVAMAQGALTGLLFQYEKRKDYDYLPGVKFGGAKAIVFWRRVKESGKIMAVFGDLTIKEITADQVPPPSKADEPPVPQPVH